MYKKYCMWYNLIMYVLKYVKTWKYLILRNFWQLLKLQIVLINSSKIQSFPLMYNHQWFYENIDHYNVIITYNISHISKMYSMTKDSSDLNNNNSFFNIR